MKAFKPKVYHHDFNTYAMGTAYSIVFDACTHPSVLFNRAHSYYISITFTEKSFQDILMVSDLKTVSTVGTIGVPDDHWIINRMEETWNPCTTIIGAAHCPPQGTLLEALRHADDLNSLECEGLVTYDAHPKQQVLVV